MQRIEEFLQYLDALFAMIGYVVSIPIRIPVAFLAGVWVGLSTAWSNVINS